MLKELEQARKELEQAVASGDRDLTFKKAQVYLALYKQCWPSK